MPLQLQKHNRNGVLAQFIPVMKSSYVCLQDMSGTELQIGASYVGIYIRAINDQPSIYFRHVIPTYMCVIVMLYMTISFT